MSSLRSARFQFDLDLIAPEQVDETAREQEWRRLIAHFVPRLRDYFRGRVEDGDALDELLSFVITKAVRKLHTIGHSDAAWNWFRTTGANRIREMRRGARRREARIERYATEQQHLQANVVDPSTVDVEEEDLSLGGRITVDRSTLDARLAALSTDERRLFNLVSRDGKNHNEVAEILLISAPACRKRYSRIVGFLRTGQRQS